MDGYILHTNNEMSQSAPHFLYLWGSIVHPYSAPGYTQS